jgi:hypothetical protein
MGHRDFFILNCSAYNCLITIHLLNVSNRKWASKHSRLQRSEAEKRLNIPTLFSIDHQLRLFQALKHLKLFQKMLKSR